MVLCVAHLLFLHISFIQFCYALFTFTKHCLKKAKRHRQVREVVLDLLVLEDIFIDVGVPFAKQGLKFLNIRVVKVHAHAQFGVRLDAVAILVDLGPEIDFFTLQTIVTNLIIVQVQVLLEDDLLPLVDHLNDDVLVGVPNIKDDRLVPNRLRSILHRGLRERLVLEELDEGLTTVLQVLSVHDVHLKLRVAPNAHLSHVLSLGLHGLMKLLFDLILLPGMVDNVAHDFGLALKQLVSGVDVRQDEFVSS